MSDNRITIGASEARRLLVELFEEVRFKGKRVVIMRYGKPVAALISMEDLAALPDKCRARTKPQEGGDECTLPAGHAGSHRGTAYWWPAAAAEGEGE